MWRKAAFIALIGIVVPTTKFESWEKETRPLVIPDPCPHLEKNSASLELYAWSDTLSCCGAPPGFYVVSSCSSDDYTNTVIALCKPGTYITEKAHNRTSCTVDNVQCKAGMIKISTIDAIPSCVCQKGYFMNKNNLCQRHTPCPPGHGVVTVANSKNDTGCKPCPPGYESLISSTTEVCYPKANQSFIEFTERTFATTAENKQTEEVGDMETEDTEENENHRTNQCQGELSWGLLAGTNVATAILVFIIGICILRYNQVISFDKHGLHFRQQPVSTNSSENSIMGSSHMRQQSSSDNREDHVNLLLEFQPGFSPSCSGPPPDRTLANDNLPTCENNEQTSARRNSTEEISENTINMNLLKLDLSDFVAVEDTKELFRYFTAEKRFLQEIQLDDLMERGSTSKDKFCRVFEELRKLLPYEKFCPKKIYSHFVARKKLLLAERTKPFVTASELSQ